MIYSRWRPDVGGYDYFESSARLPLGDDLPVPSLPPGTSIGVPSTEAGRSAIGQLRRVGSGQQARGSILVSSGAGIGALDVANRMSWLLLIAAAGAGGYYLGRSGR